MQRKAESICSEIQRETRVERSKIKGDTFLMDLDWNHIGTIPITGPLSLYSGMSSSFEQNVSLFQVVVDETFKLIFSQILLLVNYGVCLPKCCFFYCKSSGRSFPHKMLFLRKSCRGEENSLLCSAHAVQLSIYTSVYIYT